MEEKKKIYTTLKNGSKIEYDVLFTFKNEDNKKNYIIYTDNTYDQNNKLKVFAAIYDPNTYEFLEVPESQEEWNRIYEIMDKIIKGENQSAE